MDVYEKLMTKALVDHLAYEKDKSELDRAYNRFFYAIVYSAMLYLVILHWVPDGIIRDWGVIIVPLPLILYCMYQHTRLRKLRQAALNEWTRNNSTPIKNWMVNKGYKVSDDEDNITFYKLLKEYCEENKVNVYKKKLILNTFTPASIFHEPATPKNVIGALND